MHEITPFHSNVRQRAITLWKKPQFSNILMKKFQGDTKIKQCYFFFTEETHLSESVLSFSDWLVFACSFQILPDSYNELYLSTIITFPFVSNGPCVLYLVWKVSVSMFATFWNKNDCWLQFYAILPLSNRIIGIPL